MKKLMFVAGVLLAAALPAAAGPWSVVGELELSAIDGAVLSHPVDQVRGICTARFFDHMQKLEGQPVTKTLLDGVTDRALWCYLEHGLRAKFRMPSGELASSPDFYFNGTKVE